MKVIEQALGYAIAIGGTLAIWLLGTMVLYDIVAVLTGNVTLLF